LANGLHAIFTLSCDAEDSAKAICNALATDLQGIESAMHRPATRRRAFRIVLASALVGTLLSGCSTAGGPLAPLRSPAKTLIVQDQTIALDEAAVLGAPLDPALRARLGGAYLSAGRFASAAMIFSDAVALGDTTPATTLRLALALTGSGREDEAAALLFDRSEDLPAADLGLALALAGEVQPAIRFMEAAIRDGENSVALRQNLALTYALAGRWREARLMAALDVPANALGARMEQWAALSTGDTRQRLAMVLRVPASVPDFGVPVTLALGLIERRAGSQAGVTELAASAASTVATPAVQARLATAAEADALVVPPAEMAGAEIAAQPVAPVAVVPSVPLLVAQEPIQPVAYPNPLWVAEAAVAQAATPALPAYFRRQNRSGGARW
jgi:tetratricopeptide (TPR) repeat protein